MTFSLRLPHGYKVAAASPGSRSQTRQTARRRRGGGRKEEEEEVEEEEEGMGEREGKEKVDPICKKIHDRKTYRDRTYISSCQGLGRRGDGETGRCWLKV